ncbi:MAG: putative metal-binding motif-containing protein [Myxococcota bacterium]
MGRAGALLLVLAWVCLLDVGTAQARSAGITGRSGKDGTYCSYCHNGPDPTYELRVEMDPGPYSASNVYQVRFIGRRTTSFQGGFNAALAGVRNGGTFTKPASETNLAVSGNEGHHTSRRSSAVANGAHEVTWTLNWRPPLVGASENNVVRIYWASNTGVSNKTQVMIDGTGTWGFPVTVERLPCDDADGDGYFPTACVADPASGGGDCDDAHAAARPGGTEICDGLDNNCDGNTDPGYTFGGLALGQPCDGNDADQCVNGTVACNGAGTAAVCNETVSYTERCNSVDDDCDGATDEGFTYAGKTPGQTCDGNDTDLCVNGTVACAADGSAAVCNETVSFTEQCNGSDDDCDGSTDEGFTAGGRSPGQSCDGNDGDYCTEGTVQCTSPTSAECVESGTGHVELCNGVDDDCDTVTDEGFPGVGAACDGPDADQCATGVRQCSGDGTYTLCTETESYTELCNAADDDCDGLTDELFPTLGAQCDGVDGDRCALGTLTCKADGSGVECVNETASYAEACNTVDDDCDGQTDEGFPGLGATCDGPDADRCQDGVMRCTGDGAATECVETVSHTESCNGADDDCDGQTDEDFPTLGAACDGNDADECAAGAWVCDASGTGVECGNDVVQPAETCNGRDDDCNGQVDDGCVMPDAGVVDAGAVVDAGCVDGELCNGRDDDCDGVTDEDFVGLGEPCEGDDPDTCFDGVVSCSLDGLELVCAELLEAGELCNGMDDDCDGDTDEDFLWEGLALGTPCDGPDQDLCVNGAVVCSEDGTAATCVEAAELQERCNALDDDCDGETDEDFPTLNQACDSDDGDLCAEGVVYCRSNGAGTVCIESGNHPERCNGYDDDCDGEVDEGCPPPDAGVTTDAAVDEGDAGAGSDAAVEEVDAGGEGADAGFDAGVLRDAGVGRVDAGARRDAGGARADSGVATAGADGGAPSTPRPPGCQCATDGTRPPVLVLLLGLLLWRRRERRQG